MHHRIPTATLGPHGAGMVRAIETCIHCGLCLPACPTYQLLGEEMDSPRGRIFLMKDVLEGRLPPDEATLQYVDRCLGCLACQAVCPSGVHYEALVVPFRAHAERRRRRPLLARAVRGLALRTLPYPGRFRLAARAGRLARPLRGLLPSPLAAMLELLPDHLPPPAPLPAVVPAEGRRRARVALLVGCVQRVLAPEITAAAVRVLARNGVEVVVPPGQGCCGALPMHAGADRQARTLARGILAAFPRDVDAVVTTAAGCGSAMKAYPLLFAGDGEGAGAEAFARRVRDVSEVLDGLGLVPGARFAAPVRVAYHDACHLAQAQGIRAAPRRLLAAVENAAVVEVTGGEACCGSAGIYNLKEPAIARALGDRKAAAIRETGAAVVASGNIGCLVQLRAALARTGPPLPVRHTVELLDLAYRGAPPG